MAGTLVSVRFMHVGGRKGITAFLVYRSMQHSFTVARLFAKIFTPNLLIPFILSGSCLLIATKQAR
ncbi:hypothetical protein CLV83_3317 [Marinobacterium mangrovicola]|uniref:Uncharacterized protein n=1 Tax=Marinobacterium mangrovicola TaxID=1476959 RepID=A0A4R1GAS3_9GAMM|nr:hypothetical protein CLV83_3317 [Marinobacterium mangrovicola]